MPRRATPQVLKEEKRRQKLDKCAIAATEMVLDEFDHKAWGSRKAYDSEGNLTWNKHTLHKVYMNDPTAQNFNFRYENDPYFKKRVAFELWRRQDPRFRRDQMTEVWSRIIDGTLEALFERVELHANSLSTSELLKVLDLGLKVGEVGRKLSDDKGISRIMGELPADQREKLYAEEQKSLEKRMKLLREAKDAHDGADLQGL